MQSEEIIHLKKTPSDKVTKFVNNIEKMIWTILNWQKWSVRKIINYWGLTKASDTA